MTLPAFTPRIDIALHKRRFDAGREPTIAELQQLLATAARCSQVDEKYLPIFLRVEREIEERQRRRSVLDRVMAVAAMQPPAG